MTNFKIALSRKKTLLVDFRTQLQLIIEVLFQLYWRDGNNFKARYHLYHEPFYHYLFTKLFIVMNLLNTNRRRQKKT